MELPPEATDLGRVLDDELTGLPDHLREPVVVCLLEGRTQEQAAADLRISQRTVRRRLDEGRRLLRSRLERRGVVPIVAAGLVAGLGQVTASVPMELLKRTVSTVFDFLTNGAAVASPAVYLAKGATVNTYASKLKVVAVMMVLTGVTVGTVIATAPPSKESGLPPPVSPPPLNKPEFVSALPLPVSDTGTPAQTGAKHVGSISAVAPSPAIKRAIENEATYQWAAISRRWFGSKAHCLPQKWDLQIEFQTDNKRNQGYRSIDIRNQQDAKRGHEKQTLVIWFNDELGTVIRDMISASITTLIFLEHIGHTYPILYGIGTLATEEGYQVSADQWCRQRVKRGEAIRLSSLLDKNYNNDKYINVISQSYSIVRFLLTQNPRIPQNKADAIKAPDLRLVTFLIVGRDHGWDTAAKEVYGFDNLNTLEAKWIAWLQTPESRYNATADSSPAAVAPTSKSPGFERVKDVVAQLIKNHDANILYDNFVKSGGTIEIRDTFSGGAFDPDDPRRGVKIYLDTKKVKTIDYATGVLLFELIRHKYSKDLLNLDTQVKNKKITPDTYADECEKDSYKFMKEHHEMAAKAIDAGDWKIESDILKVHVKSFDTWEKYLQFAKESKHWNQFYLRGKQLQHDSRSDR